LHHLSQRPTIRAQVPNRGTQHIALSFLLMSVVMWQLNEALPQACEDTEDFHTECCWYTLQAVSPGSAGAAALPRQCGLTVPLSSTALTLSLPGRLASRMSPRNGGQLCFPLPFEHQCNLNCALNDAEKVWLLFLHSAGGWEQTPGLVHSLPSVTSFPSRKLFCFLDPAMV
jgi:hypothetical protein